MTLLERISSKRGSPWTGQNHLEVGGAGEALVALIALVRPLSSVGPLVLEKLATACELFAAVRTRVRLLAAVNPQMNDQPLLHRERFACYIHNKHSLINHEELSSGQRTTQHSFIQ